MKKTGKLITAVVTAAASGLFIFGVSSGAATKVLAATYTRLYGVEEIVSDMSENGSSFTILEIVPDENYSSFGYLVNGEENQKSDFLVKTFSRKDADTDEYTFNSETLRQNFAEKLINSVNTNSYDVIRYGYEETLYTDNAALWNVIDRSNEIYTETRRGMYVAAPDGVSGDYSYSPSAIANLTYRNADTVNSGDTVNLTLTVRNGRLSDDARNNITGADIRIYAGGMRILSDTVDIPCDGTEISETAAFTVTDSANEIYAAVTFGGKTYYSQILTVKPDADITETHTAIHTVKSVNGESADDETIISAGDTVTLQLTDSDGNALAGYTIKGGDGSEYTTDENGAYTVTIPTDARITLTAYAEGTAVGGTSVTLAEGGIPASASGTYDTVTQSDGGIETSENSRQTEYADDFVFTPDAGAYVWKDTDEDGAYETQVQINKIYFRLNIESTGLFTGNVLELGLNSDADEENLAAKVDVISYTPAALENALANGIVSLSDIDMMVISDSSAIDFAVCNDGGINYNSEYAFNSYFAKTGGVYTNDISWATAYSVYEYVLNTNLPVVYDISILENAGASADCGNNIVRLGYLLNYYADKDGTVYSILSSADESAYDMSAQAKLTGVSYNPGRSFGKVKNSVFIHNDTVYGALADSRITQVLGEYYTSDTSVDESALAGMTEIVSEIENDRFYNGISSDSVVTEYNTDVKIVVTQATVLKYILNYSGRRTVVKKDVINVLDIEPTKYSTLTASQIMSWLDTGENDVLEINITQMTTYEFIGSLEDIAGTYDMIYIGGCIGPEGQTGAMYQSGGKTAYNDSSMNGLIYTHTGDIAEVKSTFGGLLDRESRNNTVLTRYSGNDITQDKYEELLKYAQAGYPVVIDSVFISSRGGASSVNTDYIDNSSYLYKFMNSVCGGSYTETITEAEYNSATENGTVSADGYEKHTETVTTSASATEITEYYADADAVTGSYNGASLTSDKYYLLKNRTGYFLYDSGSGITSESLSYSDGDEISDAGYIWYYDGGLKNAATGNYLSFSGASAVSSENSAAVTLKYETSNSKWRVSAAYGNSTTYLYNSSYSNSISWGTSKSTSAGTLWTVYPVTADNESYPDFSKAQSADGITDGEYIIAGAYTGYSAGKAVSSDISLNDISSEISDTLVKGHSNENSVWIVAESGNSYTIKNKATGRYLNVTSSGVSVSDTAIPLNITYRGNGSKTGMTDCIYISSAPSSYLAYNSYLTVNGSGGDSASWYLYKKTEDSSYEINTYTHTVSQGDSLENVMSTLNVTKLTRYINMPRINITMVSQPVEYSYTLGADGEPTNIVYNGTHTLSYEFEFANSAESTGENLTYTARIYIDINADGQYLSAETLDGLTVTETNTGREVSADSLKSGTRYTLTRTLADDYTGLIPWQLTVSLNSESDAHRSVTGFTAIQNTEKQTINILQINANYTDSLSLNSTKGFTDDSSKSFKSLIEALNSDDSLNVELNITDVRAGSGNHVPYNIQIIGDIYTNGGYTSPEDFYRRYLSQYDMLVMGFADYFGDIENDDVMQAIVMYINSGKPVLFAHDTTSYNNGLYASTDNSGWGYHMNQYVRSLAGMDRYGLSLGSSMDSSSASSLKTILAAQNADYDTDSINGLNSLIAENSKDTASKPSDNGSCAYAEAQGFTNSTIDLNKTSNSAYSKRSLISSGSQETKSITQVNKGQITSFPYDVNITDDDGKTRGTRQTTVNGTAYSTVTLPEMAVETSHMQYYQLDYNYDINGDGQNDLVVWYALANSNSNTNYDCSPNDVRNNYYIYSVGNVMYTGMGHNGTGGATTKEAELFINTLFAAYSLGVHNPTVSIVSDVNDKSSDINCIYADFDGTDVLDAADETLGMYISDVNILNGRKSFEVHYCYKVDSESEASLDATGSPLYITENGTKVWLKDFTGNELVSSADDVKNNTAVGFTVKKAWLESTLENQTAVKLYVAARTKLEYYGADGHTVYNTEYSSFVFNSLTIRRRELFDID